MSWVFLWAFAHAMKLHVDLESDAKLNISRLREMTCEEAAPAFVKGLAKELNKGHGYDSMFYKGCLKFVQRNANASIPVISQIEKFGTVCKQGRFVENETVLAKAMCPTNLIQGCSRMFKVTWKQKPITEICHRNGFNLGFSMVLPKSLEPIAY